MTISSPPASIMYLGGNGGMGLSMGRRIFSTSTDIAFPIVLSLKFIEFSARVYYDLQHFSSSFFPVPNGGAQLDTTTNSLSPLSGERPAAWRSFTRAGERGFEFRNN